MARSDSYSGYYGSPSLGITNPFAQNLPDLADIDKTISEIEHNKLLGEDLRSQIAERAANAAWQQKEDDFGGMPGAPKAAAPAAASGGAATLTPYVPRNLPPGISPEEDLRVRTAYGEAGGEGAIGQQAVNSVLSNRVAQSGRPLSDVIFAPGQFEPWNNPTTRAKLEALDPNSREYQTILANLRAGKDDPTGGATHFYSPRAQAQLGRPAPTWGNAEPSAVIGGHNFYRIGYAPGGGAPGAFPGTATAAATPVPPVPPPAPPPARTGPGVAGRIPGAYDTSGATVPAPDGAPGAAQPPPGGGPQFTSPAEAVALGSAGRALLNMPEADAAAAYPGMIKELQAQGFALNAPPTYPGHAGIQHLAEVGQTAQQGSPDAPYAVAGQPVPPPTPPEPTNDRGLTASDIRELQEMKHSKGATRATVAQAEMTMRQRNLAAGQAYRNELQQDASTQVAAQTRADALAHQRTQDARQARIDRAKEDADAVEANKTFHGKTPDDENRNILIAGTKSGKTNTVEYQSAYADYAKEKRDANGLTWKPDMDPYATPTGKTAGGGEGGRSLGKSDVSQGTLAPPAIQTAMLGNVAGLRNIERALKELDAHPDSVGARGIQPDWLIQRTDPEGVQLRAEIADILSQTFHDRSGAAVMVSEAGRMKPFTPVQTDTAAALRTKLERMRDIYRGTLYDHYDVYGPSSGGRANPRVEKALEGYDPDKSGAPAAAPAVPPPPPGFKIVP
jgi:hypothetical protein